MTHFSKRFQDRHVQQQRLNNICKWLQTLFFSAPRAIGYSGRRRRVPGEKNTFCFEGCRVNTEQKNLRRDTKNPRRFCSSGINDPISSQYPILVCVSWLHDMHNTKIYTSLIYVTYLHIPFYHLR